MMIQIANKRPTGRKYWRSLDQYYQTPEFQKWIAEEFPASAAQMLDEPSRRNVLKIMAASFGLAGLTACRRPVEHILPNARGVEDYIHGNAVHYNTVMSVGGGVVGLMAESNDGRPTKIEGNPEHPLSLGRAKAIHQASVLDLYDPDRTPGLRAGDRDADWGEFTGYVSQQFDPAKVGQGQKIRFLTGHINSPSLNAIRTHLLSRFPAAKWVEYEPVQSLHNFAPSLPRYTVEKADVIVALDCDFLGIDDYTIEPAKKFAARRRVMSESDTMNRLYAVESAFTITGANAEHRLRLRSSDIAKFTGDLLSAVNAAANPLKIVGQGGPAGEKFLSALVKDLVAHRGRSLVLAGPRQPASVHALVQQINQALGNVGQTVAYVRNPSPQTKPQLEALKELAGELASGQVDTLVITAWNPVFSAPADLEFEANVKKVAHSIYLANDFDETAAVSKWVIPAAHYLESWGDAVAHDGSAVIQQPLIDPLHGGKTVAELIALVSGYKDQRAYDIVRNHWTGSLGGDKAWRKALHDGVVPKAPASSTEATMAAATTTASAAQPEAGIEVVFMPDYSVYDGRYANNAWLQENPDPITKLTWDNAALVSPATARQLGVSTGEIISIERNGRKLEAPVLVQPGQADNSIALSLGYGRRKSGRVAEGAGVNAYSVRFSDTFAFGTGYKTSKTGGTYPLVQTQEHHTMTEPLTGNTRPMVREATLEHFRKEPGFAEEMVEHPPLRSIYGDYDYSRGQQWGMTIDLNACIGCGACTIACQAENNISTVGKRQVSFGREMHWIRVDRYYTGDENDPHAVTQPVPCMQCETAPCENVCPVAATVHSPEGLNDMAYNRCVGTRYCSNNCPYKVRRFNFLNWHEGESEIHKAVYNPDVTVRMRGIMEKCTYCVQRIQEKKIDAKAQGRRHTWLNDAEVQTACQQTCPADAIVFGNVNDTGSKIYQTKNSERNYALLAEINTKPRTTYLAKLRNPNPELEVQHG
jgi:molybdopterin-containing oxidoreductase family iron-sulfur binding subunit